MGNLGPNLVPLPAKAPFELLRKPNPWDSLDAGMIIWLFILFTSDRLDVLSFA